MEKEKIESYFKKYADLRVLFFFDPMKEYEDAFQEIELKGIHKVRLVENYFDLKIRLNGEWLNEKVFLYLPMAAPATQDEYRSFPLLDLMIANKVLQLDNLSDFMEEFGLQGHQRSLVQKYIKELKFSFVKNILQPILTPDLFEEKILVKGLFSSFVKFNKIEEWEIIIVRILTFASKEYHDDLTRLKNKIESLNLASELNHQLSRYLGPVKDPLTADLLKQLLKKLKYNAITLLLGKPKSEDPYAPLKIHETTTLSVLHTLLEKGQAHEKTRDDFRKVLETEADTVREDRILEMYGPDAEYSYLPDRMKWELLAHHMQHMADHPSMAQKGFEKIHLQAGDQPVLHQTLQFVSYAADTLIRIRSISSYILDRPEEYVESYRTVYYKIDQSYRLSIAAYHKTDITELPEKISLTETKDLLEKKYEQYLEKLNREWIKCLSTRQFDYEQVQVIKQYEFYEREIRPADQKIAVIISDALRYEAAESLLSELHADAKNLATLGYALASIPSKTSVGMANLLPGKDYQFKADDVQVNGISISGIENREKILQLADPDAHAVQFNQVEASGLQENRELFKSKVVYIYHDVIDAIGDKKLSERKALEAVEDAIEELRMMIKKLHSSFNVARVIITADHGFIYNDRTIEEKDKEDPPGWETVVAHNRFCILPRAEEPTLGYVFPLARTTRFKDDLHVLIPASVNRYKRQGSGQQFVHGGASLQELIVPVIISSRKREDIAQKVNPVLVTKNLKIVSNVLKLQLLQEKKVSLFEKERELRIGIYKGHELVSNEEEIVMDATSDLPSARSYTCTLNLLSSAGQQTVLKLKIFDKSDPLNPLIEENVINTTLIESDF